WWGIALYLFQLGSRRQLDFDLDADDTQVLDNLNRLAQTQQTTRPVHDTLDHFLEHVVALAFVHLGLQMVRRLIRMKVLEAARLLGYLVVLIDGTGLLCFHRRHCDHCLVQLCPRKRLERDSAEGTRQVYRWVKDLHYEDSDRRRWQLHALECLETSAAGVATRFVWLTRLPVSATNVEEIARKGGRDRW